MCHKWAIVEASSSNGQKSDHFMKWQISQTGCNILQTQIVCVCVCVCVCISSRCENGYNNLHQSLPTCSLRQVRDFIKVNTPKIVLSSSPGVSGSYLFRSGDYRNADHSHEKAVLGSSPDEDGFYSCNYCR
jgi:hypothetical protein